MNGRPVIAVLVPENRRVNMLTPEALHELERVGKLRIYDDPTSLSQQELVSIMLEAAVIVTGWGSPLLPVETVEELEAVVKNGERGPLHICNVTGGMRRTVPREMVQSEAFRITNWGTSISPFVAETALTLLLACTRRMRYRFEEVVLRGGWQGEYREGGTLYGKRIGFFGFGAIARCLHALLSPFECLCSYYDPYVKVDSREYPNLTRLDSVDKLFQENEIISIHAGLTDETRGMIDHRRLAMLPDDAILVNTARGAIIDQEGLHAILQEKPIWFGFDVTHPEPPPAASFLLKDHHVVVTPHLGGKVGRDQVKAMSRTAVDNITRFLEGKPLRFEISVDQYDRMT